MPWSASLAAASSAGSMTTEVFSLPTYISGACSSGGPTTAHRIPLARRICATSCAPSLVARDAIGSVSLASAIADELEQAPVRVAEVHARPRPARAVAQHRPNL